MATKVYSNEFYDSQSNGSYKSAQSVIPILLKYLQPQSVVDLGCGMGVWLKVFEEHGIKDILGIEGEYVKSQSTYIPKEKYIFHDLATRFNYNRKFDLAISLEVGEHLPDISSNDFVSSLCNLSNIVLFSAAIKGQEGTLHINEQMPDYWAKIFKKNNYIPIDFLRPLIWDDSNIEVWYRQNAILYVKKEALSTLNSYLIECQKHTHSNFLFKIHEEKYFDILKRKEPFHFLNYWWNKLKRSRKKY